MSDSSEIFDVRLHRLKKDKSVRTFAQANFLALEIEKVLWQRLEQFSQSFQSVLVLGCPAGYLKEKVSQRFKHLTFFEQADRQTLMYQDQYFDLVIDGFGLHWVNHVPHALLEIKRILMPKGIYLAGFLGEKTLTELRQVLIKTDLSLFHGAYARVSPFIQLQTISELLMTMGFENPVVDHDKLEVHYRSIFELIRDLRHMGETNCLKGTPAPYRRNYFYQADALYKELFAVAHDKIKVTFDCIYFIGENNK